MRRPRLGLALVKKAAHLLVIGSLVLPAALASYADPTAAQTASPYKLPWEAGVQQEVTQGNCQKDASGKWTTGCSTHARSFMWFAWDFGLPEGTQVLAARAGSVAIIQDKWDANHFGSPYPIKNPPPGYIVDPDIGNQANYVVIDHGDGSTALYLHLSKVPDAIKAKARTKGRVEQGEELGLSGKTGWTHGYPHLHFQVQDSGGWFTRSRRISFSDKDVLAKNADGMPTAGGAYASGNGQQGVVAASRLPQKTPLDKRYTSDNGQQGMVAAPQATIAAQQTIIARLRSTTTPTRSPVTPTPASRPKLSPQDLYTALLSTPLLDHELPRGFTSSSNSDGDAAAVAAALKVSVVGQVNFLVARSDQKRIALISYIIFPTVLDASGAYDAVKRQASSPPYPVSEFPYPAMLWTRQISGGLPISLDRAHSVLIEGPTIVEWSVLADNVLIWTVRGEAAPPGSSDDPDLARAAATHLVAVQGSAPRSVAPADPQGSVPLPAATSPAAAARSFIQALVSGDNNAALQLMPASAQVAARAALPNISNALRPCSGSQAEAAGGTPQGGIISVQFTPACGNYGVFFSALPPQSPDAVSQQVLGSIFPVNQYGSRPLAGCTVTVGKVNDEWKVYYAPSCLPAR